MKSHILPHSLATTLVFAAVAVFADTTNQAPVSGTGTFPDTDIIAAFGSEAEIDEYVSSCLRPTWQDIMRYPDDYVGKDVAVQGKVGGTERRKHFLTLSVPGRTDEPWWIASWNQTVRPRGLFLGGDEIAVFGRVRATEEESSDTLCPRIDARYIEVISADRSIDDIIAKSKAKHLAKAGGKAEFKWRTEKIDSGGVRIFLDKDCLEMAFGEVVVPAEIDGVPVRIVGDKAFAGFDSITKVTLPEGIRAIGQKAFTGCTSLEEVQTGNVAYIAANAFEGCPKQLRIVSSGGEYAERPKEFGNCDSDRTD